MDNDSILSSVKDYLGIHADTEAFDQVLIILINMAFATLNDLGVGPKELYSISGGSEVWSDFTDTQDIDRVKTYVFLRTMLIFDPPQTHVVMDALKEIVHELEWRLRTRVEDYGKED